MLYDNMHKQRGSSYGQDKLFIIMNLGIKQVNYQLGKLTVDAVQKNGKLLIISMDANKAFDIIEPSILFWMLKAMDFGEKLINCYNTL